MPLLESIAACTIAVLAALVVLSAAACVVTLIDAPVVAAPARAAISAERPTVAFSSAADAVTAAAPSAENWVCNTVLTRRIWSSPSDLRSLADGEAGFSCDMKDALSTGI
jgi:hypothetical protein